MKLRSATQALILAAALGATVPSAMAESTNSTTFEGWANDTATQYDGRVPRERVPRRNGPAAGMRALITAERATSISAVFAPAGKRWIVTIAA